MTTNEALEKFKLHNIWKTSASYEHEVFIAEQAWQSATTEANKRIAELESEVAELKELLSDRTQDLEFEYNRAEENFLNCGILQSKLDNLKDIHEGINCPVCGSIALTPKEIWYTKQISELQASNHDLREAIETALYGHGNDALPKLRKALSATPAESLQAFENAVIEKCAKVCEGGNFLTESSPEYMFAKSAAKAIRAIKEVK